MTKDDLKNLKFGDVVRHVMDNDAYIVTGNYGERVTAVRTVDLTHAAEWELLRKANHEKPEKP